MFYVIIIAWILLDLFTKYLAKIYLEQKITILWDILYLKYTENSGIAFSIVVSTFLLKIITIILIFWIFYYYLNVLKKKENIIIDFGFSLILAWAIWNWIERIFNSKVIDFVWIKYFSVFNLADSFITIWVILYLYTLYSNKK